MALFCFVFLTYTLQKLHFYHRICLGGKFIHTHADFFFFLFYVWFVVFVNFGLFEDKFLCFFFFSFLQSVKIELST